MTDYSFPKDYPPQFIGISLCGQYAQNGTSCKAPAMTNGKCRWHGGRNRGAPRGNKNALKHGYFTAKAIAERKKAKTKLKQAEILLKAWGLV